MKAVRAVALTRDFHKLLYKVWHGRNHCSAPPSHTVPLVSINPVVEFQRLPDK